jgi:hypothetical protein
VAKCEYCNKDMSRAKGCTLPVFDDFPDGLPTLRIKYGDEPQDWGAKRGRRCGDCGCQPGNYHHPGCDIEHCPRCLGQAISCRCTEGNKDDFDDDDYGDPDWRPLSIFFGAYDAPEIAGFQLLKVLEDSAGIEIWLYQHRDTRWCLWLDECGLAYRRCDTCGALEPTSRATALAMAYDGIDERPNLSAPGSMPRYEVFPTKTNRPKAA